MKITDKHVFFYTEWPSNFRKTSFTFEAFGETHRFFCTEQAFMWCKAMYFNDTIIAEKILNEKSNPMTCKKFGRLVRGYNDDKWKLVRYSFMLDVNFARFTQDKNLKEKILNPEYDGKTFVEASPTDRIWGIGIGENDPDIDDERHWFGQNLLGKVITEVRNRIKHDEENKS